VLCDVEVGLFAFYTTSSRRPARLQRGMATEMCGQQDTNISRSSISMHVPDLLWHDREEPLSVQHGLAIEDHDQEGRVITAEFPHFYLTNVYTPNSGAHARPLCGGSTTCRRRKHRQLLRLHALAHQLAGACRPCCGFPCTSAGDGLRRLVYRTQRWDTDFAAHVRRLRERKPVIITGDFNCAHKVLEPCA
jgi:exonuclease III